MSEQFTFRDFCFWLEGFNEACKGNMPPDYFATVKAKRALVTEDMGPQTIIWPIQTTPAYQPMPEYWPQPFTVTCQTVC